MTFDLSISSSVHHIVKFAHDEILSALRPRMGAPERAKDALLDKFKYSMKKMVDAYRQIPDLPVVPILRPRRHQST